MQGLRAIAILLAIVYHADIQPFSGGYVGIEVFFVISGFVITGLLLRERETTGHTSLRSFYGRRARRIIPMATLVIIVTVIVTYHSLGTLVGHQTALDGAWSAVFLANVHFQATDTNYLLSQAPPSPLLNYWSLGVEEQFYIVYPALFLFLGWWAQRAQRGSFRLRLTVVLVVVIVASYTYSIVFTASNAQSAYFSLLVRSWELALGGLIAVYSPELRRIPQAWAAVASWVGLAVILVTSVTLTPASEYPGALVAIPTLAAGLVIAAGASAPKWGVELLLRRQPFPFLALISFSLYLWHWPILEIAAQRRGVATLPVWDDVLLLVGAGILASLTYRFIENPVRHAKFLVRRKWASLIMGLCLIIATLAVTTYEQRRPTVDLGPIAQATSGSDCRSPSPSAVAHLRSTSAPISSDNRQQIRAEVGRRGRRFDRVLSSHRPPSRRAFLWHAVRERCRHRLWRRQRCHRPRLPVRPQRRRVHDVVSGSSQFEPNLRPLSATIRASFCGEAPMSGAPSWSALRTEPRPSPRDLQSGNQSCCSG